MDLGCGSEPRVSGFQEGGTGRRGVVWAASLLILLCSFLLKEQSLFSA